MDIASVRIFRLATGTALCLMFSQVFAWPMSFIAPIFTLVILAVPIPALSLSAGIKFVLVFMIAMCAGLILLPFMVHYRIAGLLLVSLALFHSFYFTAKGGSALLGTLMTVGITIVASVGSVSIDAILAIIQGLAAGVVAGVSFVWIGHAIFPDSMAVQDATASRQPPPAPPKPDLTVARYSAFRSLLIVMPILIWFLLSGASASYTAVMIKVASMGQQASVDETKNAAKSLLISTVIGGVGSIICWQLLSIWPSLILYTLLILAAGLIVGPYIFKGPGMSPAGATWSYGMLTLIVILAPAVMDGQTGASADAAFWSRFLMFIGASLYGVVAVHVFDFFSHDAATSEGSPLSP